jgi:hypothetical protein
MRDRILLVLARDAQTGYTHSRRAQLPERSNALRALLGRRRRAAQPSLRALLLPGDRVRHRARPPALRGRRAGRA